MQQGSILSFLGFQSLCGEPVFPRFLFAFLHFLFLFYNHPSNVSVTWCPVVWHQFVMCRPSFLSTVSRLMNTHMNEYTYEWIHIWKWRANRDEMIPVIETVFFHRYHLGNCRPQFHYECDWNGARISVIVQQTKKWFVWIIILIIIIIWRFRQLCHLPVIYLNDNLWPSRGCW